MKRGIAITFSACSLARFHHCANSSSAFLTFSSCCAIFRFSLLACVRNYASRESVRVKKKKKKKKNGRPS
jgi:hypothetical protein